MEQQQQQVEKKRGRPSIITTPEEFEEYKEMRRSLSLRLYHVRKNNERAEKLIAGLSQIIPLNVDMAQNISDAFGIPIESISHAIIGLNPRQNE